MTISEAAECTAAELGALWGVTRKRVEQLAAEGIAVRIQKGRFKLVESNRRYLAKVVERQARKSAASTELNELRSAELVLRMEERRGTLVARAEEVALATADQVLGELRADVYAIPARITQDLALRSAIERGLDDAFTAAADRCAKRANGPLMDREPVAAKAARSSRRLGPREPGVSGQRRRARSA